MPNLIARGQHALFEPILQCVPRYTATRFVLLLVFSERRSLYAIARPSVVCLSSVTLVRPTQAVQIFRNISTAFGTLAIH